jgi:hypothetical protein
VPRRHGHERNPAAHDLTMVRREIRASRREREAARAKRKAILARYAAYDDAGELLLCPEPATPKPVYPTERRATSAANEMAALGYPSEGYRCPRETPFTHWHLRSPSSR